MQVTLHDQFVAVPEAIKAMQEREAALETVFSLEENLAAKKQQLEQLQALPVRKQGDWFQEEKGVVQRRRRRGEVTGL